MPKKPLYTGDPNATMTICYAKHRRHLTSDINVRVEPAETEGGPTKVIGYCRYCLQNPYIEEEAPAA